MLNFSLLDMHSKQSFCMNGQPFHGRQLLSNSKIIALQPKIDDDGLIRSDGRLQNAKFVSYDVRYPVILP